MTVASETARSGPYVGNGSLAIFQYEFLIQDASHLTVIKTAVDGTDTTLATPADYLVTGVGDPAGGNVTLTNAPASGERITILRGGPLAQGIDYTNQGAFYAQTVEDGLDYLTMLIQQLDERLDRAVLLKPLSTIANLIFPEPVGDRILGWNAAGTEFENKTPNSDTLVTLPNSATDHAIVRFDGTTGAALQNSGVTIDDSDNLRVPAPVELRDPGFAVNEGGLHRLRALAYSGLIGFQRLPGGGFRIDENTDVDGSFTTPRRILEAVSNYNKGEIDNTFYPMPVGDTEGIGEDGTVIWNTNQINIQSTNRLRTGGAKLTPTISGGVIQSVAVDSSPSTYPASPAPRIAIQDTGGGTGAVLTAVVSGGSVTRVTVNNGGSGYTSNTALVCAPPSTSSPLDVGPQVNLIRDADAPVGSVQGFIYFIGRSDSGNVDTVYGSIGAFVKDPTFASPQGNITFATAGPFSTAAGNVPRFSLSDEGFRATGTVTLNWPGEGKANLRGLFIQNVEKYDDSGRLVNSPVVYAADDGANAGPSIFVRRASASPAASDALGHIYWDGSNSAAENTTGCGIGTFWTSPTDASESMDFRFQTIDSGTFADRMYLGSGIYMVGATGGDKGTGSINATAVYDDNTLLTCYVLEGWLDGAINVDRWDAAVPDREDEERRHERARGFAAVLKDRLDTDKLIAWVRRNRRLPAFPGPDHWRDRHNSKMASGDVLQRLWETVELLFVHMVKGHERTKALEERVAKLEERS